MKKLLKSFLTVLFATVIFMNFGLTQAKAAADNTAFLAYADSNWTYQYWGDPEDTGVVATDVEVTGPGQYTVGLDFTETEDGKAMGLAFAAPMVQGAATNFPGYILSIDSIEINGSPIEFSKGYANDEDGNIRSNIYNEWVGSLPEDARTIDGSLDGASATIVDLELFAEVETISVTFTFADADGNTGAAEETVAEEPATDSAPKTGVTSMALAYGLGALITGALVLKKKEK